MRMKGSVTVFASFGILFAAAFLFVLLEGARVQGLNANASSVSAVGIESAASEYQTVLWEKYHLLYLDGSYGSDTFSMDQVTGRLAGYISDDLAASEQNNHLLRLKFVQAQPLGYALATDENGTAFLMQAVHVMKERLPGQLADQLYREYLQGKPFADSKNTSGVEDAAQAIQNEKEAQEKAAEEAAQSADTGAPEQASVGTENAAAESAMRGAAGEASQESSMENPLEVVLEWKKNPLLGMVVHDVSQISPNQIDLAQSVSKRDRQQGTDTSKNKQTFGTTEKIILLEYLKEHFSDYTSPGQDAALSYELEYLIGGKASDRENLTQAVKRLLVLREAANMAYLLSDAEKMKEAQAAAQIAAGVFGNPALIPVVQSGIVAAWAYVESVLDVRALLAGEKIALLKTADQWTADTKNLLDALQNNSRAKECENGLSYQAYLKQILFGIQQKKLAYRMMDLMETAVQKVPEYQNFRMDFLIGSMDYLLEYEAKPLFFRYAAVGTKKTSGFSFLKKQQFSYGT